MLKSLKIENFRCFRNFELQQLGQLNLLVGTNNSGKTSILEAVQLLSSQPHLAPLQEIMMGRGEYIFNQVRLENAINTEIELDICHLFYDRKVDVGSYFLISGNNTQGELKGFRVSINLDDNIALKNGDLYWREANLKRLLLVIKELNSKNELEVIKLPLSSEESLSLNYIMPMSSSLNVKNTKRETNIVSSFSFTRKEMVKLFDQIVLTPEENLVMETLQIIEPNLKRIATISESNLHSDLRGSFFVRLTDSDKRIPIGSMGDGIWRMLGLSLAIVNAKNGVLLVDEIDTGLHFTAMSDMWKLIWKTAKKLNVQVFATTHNSDCWTSLAEIASAEEPSEEGITIQRIEKDKPHSIIFTERQIVIAAERGIEVR
jgi:AAA15 family ATPase/GTPase